MPDTFFRFADIEFGNSPLNENIVGVFRFDQGRQTRQGPYHIVVAEIESALYAYERLLDLIHASVEQSRTMLAGMSMDPFARFEKLVERVNEAIAVFAAQEPTPINWKRVNIFILECANDQLCIAGHGKLSNLFLKKENGEFKTFDLCGSLEQPAEINEKKVFASLICGDVNPGDIFFIGSNNFNRYQKQLRIKERLMELPSVSAATEMKRVLERENILEDFVGIVISAHTDDKPSKHTPIKEDSVSSMKKLQDEEADVQKTLSPTLNPLNKNQHSLTQAKPKIPKPLEGLQKTWQKFVNLIKASRPKELPGTATVLRGMNAGHGTFFTTKRKIYIGIAAILAIACVISYMTWQHNKQVAAEQANWEQKYAEATDLKNRAENDLLYAKDNQARTRIQQTEQIIASLDTSTADRKERVEKLQNGIADLNNKIRKAVTVNSVTELAALDVTAPDGSLSAPVIAESSAYGADNQNKQILKIDINSKEVIRIDLPDPATKIVSGAVGEKSVIFLDDSGKFYAVSIADNSLTPLNSFEGASSTSDFVIYNERAYVLDSSGGQIYRLNQSNAGFAKPSGYFTDAEPLAGNAVGIAIDSNVYVANANGMVSKFLSGEQAAFGLGAVEPPLRSLSAIWAISDDNRILITDPADKRLLIFDKNGLLTSQITSSEFGALRDVTSSLNQKQALVISDNRLLLVPLP
ncbi:MAG: hypothetical protein ACOYUZ_05995 [Patescibacteria group bacterium]